MSGKVAGLWVKRMKRGPMDAVKSAEFLADQGIVHNADQRGKRQVTVIEQEVWQDLMDRFGSRLPPETRRANVMTENVSLQGKRGQILRLGEVQIKLLGETKPCERMDEALPGLKQAMVDHERGGLYGVILNSGTVHIHDTATFEEGSR
ncbi:MOSC domain-containing protein [Salisediminibacterium halotolerans]|nr:MOSC domain-containing protein [Salisediminibacterium halotolerans]RLJ81060.1 MOSC domain-containing protein [Actinophytocola xinjiangensis]RPE87850.1 MOSC domain-containing protein [Salisediminibacterium halotolerans]TWG37953.1 MOSC domain-containing protein [Salisediminibacterium halotolerans]GEL09025.1 molybdenum cofactor biosysynthesis protein [Salisediminibacterium halotolerans]